jgi:hypothetical protein
LIISSLAKEDDLDRLRSFDLFRNIIPDVEVIAFDELVKARLLLNLFEGANRQANTRSDPKERRWRELWPIACRSNISTNEGSTQLV